MKSLFVVVAVTQSFWMSLLALIAAVVIPFAVSYVVYRARPASRELTYTDWLTGDKTIDKPIDEMTVAELESEERRIQTALFIGLGDDEYVPETPTVERERLLNRLESVSERKVELNRST